eukprot:scaffold68969_cov64-Phaeocystis_antarctica.AAC.2
MPKAKRRPPGSVRIPDPIRKPRASDEHTPVGKRGLARARALCVKPYRVYALHPDGKRHTVYLVESRAQHF